MTRLAYVAFIAVCVAACFGAALPAGHSKQSIDNEHPSAEVVCKPEGVQLAGFPFIGAEDVVFHVRDEEFDQDRLLRVSLRSIESGQKVQPLDILGGTLTRGPPLCAQGRAGSKRFPAQELLRETPLDRSAIMGETASDATDCGCENEAGEILICSDDDSDEQQQVCFFLVSSGDVADLHWRLQLSDAEESKYRVQVRQKDGWTTVAAQHVHVDGDPLCRVSRAGVDVAWTSEHKRMLVLRRPQDTFSQAECDPGTAYEFYFLGVPRPGAAG